MQGKLKSGRLSRLKERISASDVLVGGTVVTLLIAVLAALGVIYLRPPAQKTLTFYATDVSALSAGESVRVAGVSVGKISDLKIEKDAVKVSATIDSSTFVGNLSRVEVRMLTPVGGYAVTLVSLGENPSSDLVIPRERVQVPYSIGDVLQAAPDVTDEVKSTTVHANLDQLGKALQGNSTSLRSIVAGMDSLTEVMDKQRDQIHQIAGLAREYLETFNDNRQLVFDVIDKIDTVVATYHVSSAGFNRAYFLLGDVLTRIIPIEKFYLNHSDQITGHVDYLRNLIAQWQKQVGPAIDNLLGLRGALMKWADPNGNRGANPVSTLCVPVPGRNC